MKLEWFKTEIELTGIGIIDFSKSPLSAKLQWGSKLPILKSIGITTGLSRKVVTLPKAMN